MSRSMALYQHVRQLACGLTAILVLAGCATTRDSIDPYERYNRAVFRFNERVDQAFLEPTARAYRTVLPPFVRTGVGNVFSNIGDVRNALNNALQGKLATAYSDFGRVVINSTVGMLGLFDIASAAGVEKHQEDFGQTLGVWGLSDGPFIMLPFLGPSSGRDVMGLAVDYATDPLLYVDPTRTRYGLIATRFVDRRADLLDASTIVHRTALDLYLFVRDGYLQRRRNLVHDGVPPLELEAAPSPPR
jgi:phospholipid-binding lipoprotein MlaA